MCTDKQIRTTATDIYYENLEMYYRTDPAAMRLPNWEVSLVGAEPGLAPNQFS